jgi:TetR/AcrR family transcriptional regulator, transcriptional repressor for nem operon
MENRPNAQRETRSKLLNAAMHVMRLKGYAATTVDDVCKAAGVTKGSFFHYFDSKEALGIAAAEHFALMATSIFGSAPYRAYPDPVERLLGYVDFRIAILQGSICEFSCLLGTFVQELYDTHPAIRAACERHMDEHIAELTKDVVEAKAKYTPDAPWTPESVGVFMQTVLQGSLIFAKVKQGPQVAIEALGHLRRYIEMLFKNPNHR